MVSKKLFIFCLFLFAISFEMLCRVRPCSDAIKDQNNIVDDSLFCQFRSQIIKENEQQKKTMKSYVLAPLISLSAIALFGYFYKMYPDVFSSYLNIGKDYWHKKRNIEKAVITTGKNLLSKTKLFFDFPLFLNQGKIVAIK